MSDRDKEMEILALHHQIEVLERQVGGRRGRFEASDRAFLAALLSGLPRDVLHRIRLLSPPTASRGNLNLRLCGRLRVR
jgi:putative transposase